MLDNDKPTGPATTERQGITMEWFRRNILSVGLSVSAFIISMAVLGIVVLEWYREVG